MRFTVRPYLVQIESQPTVVARPRERPPPETAVHLRVPKVNSHGLCAFGDKRPAGARSSRSRAGGLE